MTDHDPLLDQLDEIAAPTPDEPLEDTVTDEPAAPTAEAPAPGACGDCGAPDGRHFSDCPTLTAPAPAGREVTDEERAKWGRYDPALHEARQAPGFVQRAELAAEHAGGGARTKLLLRQISDCHYGSTVPGEQWKVGVSGDGRELLVQYDGFEDPGDFSGIA